MPLKVQFSACRSFPAGAAHETPNVQVRSDSQPGGWEQSFSNGGSAPLGVLRKIAGATGNINN